eukprot:7387842-Prymnesium_polylepis.1
MGTSPAFTRIGAHCKAKGCAVQSSNQLIGVLATATGLASVVTAIWGLQAHGGSNIIVWKP